MGRGTFVDTFTIERDASNVYCLFFFTKHIRGFEKMLETKWSLDRGRGKGHALVQTPQLFSELELSGYPEKLQEFIESDDSRTNHQLFEFGLQNGFLPKHTNQVLGQLKQDGVLQVFSLDGQPARGNYISFKSKRTVGFRIDTETHRLTKVGSDNG